MHRLLLLTCVAASAHLLLAARLPNENATKLYKKDSWVLVAFGGMPDTNSPDYYQHSIADVDIISLDKSFSNGTYKAGTPAPNPITSFGSIMTDKNKIFVVGGAFQNRFWAYDIPTDRWSRRLRDFPVGNSYGINLVAVNHTLIALGGIRGLP